MGRKLISYEGQTIGNFTILKELGKGRVIARCIPCGIEKEFCKNYITSKRIKSCGCLNSKRFIDRTGQTIGNFTILKDTMKTSSVIARCNLCGKVKLYPYKSSITHQQIYSCGCTKRNKRSYNFKDYTGQTIGNFTILKELGNRRIIARCNLCGKEKEFTKRYIVEQKQKSCGCYLKSNDFKLKDLTGQTIGNFTILKELGNRKVIARCNLCGNEKEFIKYSITGRVIRSCGCLPKRTKGDDK